MKCHQSSDAPNADNVDEFGEGPGAPAPELAAVPGAVRGGGGDGVGAAFKTITVDGAGVGLASPAALGVGVGVGVLAVLNPLS